MNPWTDPNAARLASRINRWLGFTLVLFLVLDLAGIQTAPLQSSLTLLHVAPFLSWALAGTFLMHVTLWASQRERRWLIPVGACSEGLTALWRLQEGQEAAMVVFRVGAVLGVTSLLCLAARIRRGPAEVAQLSRSQLSVGAMLPLFVLTSFSPLALTASLHPNVVDLKLIVAERGASLAAIRGASFVLEHVPGLSALTHWVYLGLPFTCALVYVARVRAGSPRASNVVAAFALIGILGWLAYQFVPVVGPQFFSAALQQASASSQHLAPAWQLGPPGIARNCMPSLHTAWALCLLLYARGTPRWCLMFTSAFLALTLLATLGFGYHYLLDLVVAVPFLVFIRTLLGHPPGAPAALRLTTGILCATTVLLWFGLIQLAPEFLASAPWFTLLFSLLSAIFPLLLDQKLFRQARAPTRSPVTHEAPATSHRVVTGLFVASGFAGLAYEVVFAKQLALVFGSTATASTTVLTTYMAGLALGAWLGGRLGERTQHPLRVYALCEVGVALWCMASPWLLQVVRALYISLASAGQATVTTRPLLQCLLGGCVLLPPTLLMGITMPVLVRKLGNSAHDLGIHVARLYAANTLGAALGSLCAGYLLLPVLGIQRTLAFAAVLNGAAASGAWLLERRWSSLQDKTPDESALRENAPTSTGSASEALPGSPPGTTPAHRLGWLGLGLLTVGGVIALALETVYIHLLAVVAGNSAYAFSLMLFCFLLGLSGGATLMRRWLSRPNANLIMLMATAEFLLAFAILAGLPLWSHLPDYFASYARYPMMRAFAEREFVRLVVCALGMLPPACAVGMLFPAATAAVVTAFPRHPIRSMGSASAANTVGNIGGALMGGFVLIPLLGSHGALAGLACVAAALGTVALFLSDHRPRPALAMGACTWLLCAVGLASDFDYGRLASGANVYFQPQYYGQVVKWVESMDGGLTTIARSHHDGQVVHTMLTNGKFQGDDGGNREVRAQIGFAMIPLLHTTARERALVVGYGTGTSARVVADAGFRSVDIAELSSDVVTLANEYFSKLNTRVSERPHVQLHITDGRNFALLQDRKYDLITIEITSLWFAGAANLYNREYYQLLSSRLSERGVLQQWLQLHHLSPVDIGTVMATLRTEFSQVWLYFVSGQGVVVACNHNCAPARDSLEAIEKHAALAAPLSEFGGKASNLLSTRLLSPHSVDSFLAHWAKQGLDPSLLISTDDNLLLEYSSPRGNVHPYRASLKTNLDALQPFVPRTQWEGTQLTSQATGLPPL